MKTHGRKRSALSHWSESAFHMSLFKEIFKDTMVVKGIHVALHPFKKLKPDPQLATSSAYLRMMIVGAVKDWKIYTRLRIYGNFLSRRSTRLWSSRIG